MSDSNSAFNDRVGLLEGLATTRAIRRYLPEPIPEDVLRDIMFAATRAPSGSNRQPFRFMVFTDSETAHDVKTLIARGAQTLWNHKRQTDGYDDTASIDESSPKARMARTMQQYVDNFAEVPALVLACLVRYRAPTPTEGASIYPSCQNILLAARARGYGGVLTGFHGFVEAELRTMLSIPDDVFIAATITLGKPAGGHGPVRRVPMNDVVFGDVWGVGASWAIDPPGTATLSRGGFSS
jgi:nitroreductase